MRTLAKNHMMKHHQSHHIFLLLLPDIHVATLLLHQISLYKKSLPALCLFKTHCREQPVCAAEDFSCELYLCLTEFAVSVLLQCLQLLVLLLGFLQLVLQVCILTGTLLQLRK